jgi:CRISPR associated protein, Cas1 family
MALARCNRGHADLDVARVPDHWRSFGGRISPLTGSPRLAANPPNAILNYLYALLEAEARGAASAMGLDASLGVLHADTPHRDSLALDLLEPARAQVDSYVIDYFLRHPLRKEWFFEERNGNARLMSSLVSRLTETTPMPGSSHCSSGGVGCPGPMELTTIEAP